LENIFHNQTENPQLEQFKQLIRKIRFEIESTDSKRFLITSAREKEAKTFLLISLAYTLSLNNKKVLLIDTNFKNNTLTNMLSAKPALEKHFNQSLVKEDIVTKSKLKGIDVIGCYEGNYSPSEVFSQTNFHNLLNDLAQHYDFIFLEGAALNEYSDSKELISSVEKVISVFSTNSTIKEQDKTSIAYLRGLGEKFMGAVLNKVELSNLN
jgi:Mrp family chromosome partitioning ATPase